MTMSLTSKSVRSKFNPKSLMKNCLLLRTLLAGVVLVGSFVSNTFANHRTGDFPLPELMVAGDFNEDGKMDLVVNIAGFDNYAFLQGDGLGGFTIKRHIAEDTLPKGLAVGDLNKDHHLDLVSISDWGYSLRVNLGDGLGTFTAAKETNADGDPTRVLLGDVNNDGNLDTIANAPSEGKIIIYLGDGKGGLSNSAIEIEGLRDNNGLALGDFNKDGNLDFVTTRSTSGSTVGHVLVFLGDGAGGFNQNADLITDPSPVTLVVADMNNDGNPDIVVGGAGPENTSGNFISVLAGDGGGGFSLVQTLELGPGSLAGELGVADFNEDGKLDVAFPVDTTPSPLPSTKLLTFFGNGDGSLTPGATLKVGAEPHSALALDFNGDGHVDLAVSCRTDATLNVLLGDGHGNFSTHAVIPLAVTPAAP